MTTTGTTVTMTGTTATTTGTTATLRSTATTMDPPIITRISAISTIRLPTTCVHTT